MAESRDDPFSRSEYRRVIDWTQRFRREAPFFDAIFAGAPARTLLDVGCGTGEHVRHFAERGWSAVGIDVSESMIEQAVDHAGETAAGGRARFELRGAADATSLPEAPFGAAVCVGNTLAFVESAGDVRAFFAGVASALARGGIFLLQMLNYERIEGVPLRALPVNVRPLPPEEGGGELVFVRVLTPRGDGTVDFYPITLTLRPGREPLAEVRHARAAVHHAWKRPQLEAALLEAGFEEIRALGGMAETPYRALESPDLVIVARKR